MVHHLLDRTSISTTQIIIPLSQQQTQEDRWLPLEKTNMVRGTKAREKPIKGKA